MTDQDEDHGTTFRIRFTLSNTGRCPDYNTDQDCESHPASCTDRKPHISSSQQTRINIHPVKASPDKTKKETFKILQPQNHKSSLFINLSGAPDQTRNTIDATSHLFVSPDLVESSSTPATPPTPGDSFSLRSSYTSDDLVELSPEDYSRRDLSNNDLKIKEEPQTTRQVTVTDNMSHGCNFINTLMSASRRRSSSATPDKPNTSPRLVPRTDERRASSSNDLAVPADKTSDAHQPLVSNSTIKPAQTREVAESVELCSPGKEYMDISQMNMLEPLKVDVDLNKQEPTLESGSSFILENFCETDSQNMKEILQVDAESIRLEHECRNLEQEVQYWENKVDDLERKRFNDDVPRTLVENVLKQRKKLREIELQIFKLTLEQSYDETNCNNKNMFIDSELERNLDLHDTPETSPECDYVDHEKAFAVSIGQPLKSDPDDEEGFYTELSNQCSVLEGLSIMHNKQATGKIGSQIKPGQENTAYILDVIPPSGSFQHKQYLTKASSGTDSSDYSQIPMSDYSQYHHKHILPIVGHERQQEYFHQSHKQLSQQQHKPLEPKSTSTLYQHHQALSQQHEDDDTSGSTSSKSARSGNTSMTNQLNKEHKYENGDILVGDHPDSSKLSSLYISEGHNKQARQQQQSRGRNEDLYIQLDSIKGGISSDKMLSSSPRAASASVRDNGSDKSRLATPSNFNQSGADTDRKHRSPVRPTHFEGIFRSNHAIIPQDSSSTASSVSPHETFS